MSKFKDLTGQRFGRLIVIEKAGQNKNRNTLWKCLCDCGNETIVVSTSLTNGDTQSCDCLRRESVSKNCFINLIGQKFGRLTVKEYVGKTKGKISSWKCLCDCGNESIVLSSNLKSGTTKSCGCLFKEMIKTSRYKKYNTYNLSGEYGIGYTDESNEFYFDLEDYELIKDYCWNFNNEGYVVTSKDNHFLRMHQLIMNTKDNEIVDHKKHKLYDNRKNELRKVTHSQNSMNQQLSENNTSGCTGVTFHKQHNKWQAYITINKKQIHLGYFDDINEAIKIRKQAEEKYFGDFSYDNSIKDEVINL
jgi:hypothetical protein